MACAGLLVVMLLATPGLPDTGFEPAPPSRLSQGLSLVASEPPQTLAVEAAGLRRLLADTDLRLRALDERTSPGRLLGRTLLGIAASAGVGALLGLMAGLPVYASGGKDLLDSLLVAMGTGAVLSAAVAMVVGVVRLIAELQRSCLLEERDELQRRLESRGRRAAVTLAPATPVFVARF